MRPYVEQTWGSWNDAEQKERFHGHFDPSTDRSADRVIVLHGKDIGYLSVDDLGDSLFIGFIGVLPEHQRRGLGTHLLLQILAEADRRQIPVRLRVLKLNPARSLYERLGFVIVDAEDVRYQMERPPRPNSA